MFILTSDGHYRASGYGSICFAAHTFDEIINEINTNRKDDNAKISRIEEPTEHKGLKEWQVIMTYEEEGEEEDGDGNPIPTGIWSEDDMEWHLITEINL